MSVSAVVVSHGHAPELETLLPRLAPQVDELVVVANTSGSAPRDVPSQARVLENASPRRLSENVNVGIAATTGELGPLLQPGRPARGRRRGGAAQLRCDARALRDRRPPRHRGRTGRGSRPVAASRPSAGRSFGARRCAGCSDRSSGSVTTTCLDEDVGEPVEADWLLGAFLLMRRSMLEELGGWDEGYRHYVEDIDLCYRAMRAGWERWYVPAASVVHDWAQVTDRRFLSRHTALARAQHGPLRPRAPRDACPAVSSPGGKAGQYARKAARWSDAEYADARAYLTHRAELIESLGVPLDPGDEVLDLACGDGGLGACLLERGLRYAGVDAEPAMVEAARRKLGGAATIEQGDLNLYEPPLPVAATTVFRAIYYARDRRAFFARVAGFTERKLIFDLNPRQYRWTTSWPSSRKQASPASNCGRSSSRRPAGCPAPRSAC